MSFAADLERERRERRAEAHLPLAHARAGRLASQVGLPVDEARSAALVGLAEAIDRYRPELGEFAPFACRTIDGHIRNAAQREWRWRRRAAAQPFREIAAVDWTAVAQLPDRLAGDLIDARADVARALEVLLPDERAVVLLHGKLGHTFPACARMLGEDEDHAKYLWRRALGKMRDYLGAGPIAA